MESQKQILKAIAESLGLPVADLDPQSSLQDDLGLNLVEIADLFNSLAEKLNIYFEPGETESVKTITDLTELIEDKLLE